MQTGLDEKLKFGRTTNIIILFLTVWSLHLKENYWAGDNCGIKSFQLC